MSDHARLSPSAAHRWMQCPASIRLSADVEDKSSSYAEEGTRAHALLEKLLLAQLNGEPTPSFAGYPEDMIAAVTTAYDIIMDIVSRQQHIHDDVQLYVERKVDTRYFTGRDDIYGTADVVITTPDQIWVIDYKHGKGVPVSPVDNPQLKIYGLGVMASIAKPAKGMIPQKHIILGIIQPRVEGKAYNYDIMATADLAMWGETTLRAAAEATDDPALAPSPSESACRFCLVRGTCREAMTEAARLCSAFEPAGSVESAEDFARLANASIDHLTPEELAAIHQSAPFITGWLKAVDAEISRRLKNREPVPGLKLVVGRRMNKWDADEETIAATLLDAGIPEEKVFEKKVISAPKALKLKLEDDKRKIIHEHVKKTDGSLVIVPETDGRPDAVGEMPFKPDLL